MPDNAILVHLFTVEGWPAYADAPADRGGPTKGGITLATLRAWRGSDRVAVEDLRNLQKSEAGEIYYSMFVSGPQFSLIDDDLLRLQVVDCGVLSGPRRAASWLQELVGARVDGRVGPVTLRAVNIANPNILGIRLAARRVRFLGALIERDRAQAKWAGGWMNRATHFLDLEAARAGGHPPYTPPDAQRA